MLGFKDEWKILKTGKRSDFFTIAAIIATFILIVALNVIFIFRMTAEQTEHLGQMQLESIRSDLQENIDDAERMTLCQAARAEKILAAGTSIDIIKKIFEHDLREQKLLSDGECFNIYIANRNWSVIPDFEMPEDFHATERNWYVGAAQNPGKIFITEPYVDAAGHGLCFTVSTMLSDKNTGVALDFNFSNVQKSIGKMDTGNDRTALIVTKDGLIIGFRDANFVGEKISKILPEYQRVLETVLKLSTHENFQTEIGGRANTVFSSETKNGWQMILCNSHADKRGARHERNDFARIERQRHSRLFAKYFERGQTFARLDKFDSRFQQN